MSEFRNLQGLRNALRNDIERGLCRAEPMQKVILLFIFIILHSIWINRRNEQTKTIKLFYFEKEEENC